MIKVKLYDSKKNKKEDIGKKRILSNNIEHDFLRLVQGNIFEERKKPPLRDEDSLKFINEVDRAEFVGGEDWYSIVTPYGRTNVTALCSGTQFALVLIDNSKGGLYTDIHGMWGYGEDIWGKLAELSVDILVAFDIRKIDGHSSELPILSDYMIENYPYKGGTVEVHVRYHGYEKLHIENGDYYTGSYLRELEYCWHRDIRGLIAESERIIQYAGKRYDYPPREFSGFEFAKTLEERYANAFWEMEYLWRKEMLDRNPLPENKYKAKLWKLQNSNDYQEYIFVSETCKILSYLQHIPTETSQKYPIHLLVRKTPDGKSVMQEVYTVKYPTYSEMLFYNDIVEFRERGDEVFGLIFNTATFEERTGVMESAIWGVRNYGSTIELYDGIRVLEEFVKAVKEPYKTGNLYVAHKEYIDGKEVMIEERADKHDSII